MLKFVTFAVKIQLNVHDLNNETSAGNVTDIRLIEFLDESGKKVEAPAVSGRMLKHWHYEAMRQLGLQENLSFCDACKIGEPVRPAILINENSNKVLSHQGAIDKGAEVVLRTCVICDVHGYLAAIGETSERRSSRALFSWLVPVLVSDEAGYPSKLVIHSRVKSGMDFKETELKSQMPYSKSYASGAYALVSALDVERIGLVELNLNDENPYVLDVDDRKKRSEVAIEAYRHLISGQLGASLSHAIPHSNPLEVLVAYSESGPLPFPVSPMYSDYIEKTKGLMPAGTSLLYWNGQGGEKSGLTRKDTIDEIFTELLSKL